jgi:hypothetical protein
MSINNYIFKQGFAKESFNGVWLTLKIKHLKNAYKDFCKYWHEVRKSL